MGVMMQSKESLEQWRAHLLKREANETTGNGKHPHRVGSTGHLMQVTAINEIIDLAQKQLDMQSKGGKVAKKLAIQYLRDMVEELESEI
jgi:hypothetical protein